MAEQLDASAALIGLVVRLDFNSAAMQAADPVLRKQLQEAADATGTLSIPLSVPTQETHTRTVDVARHAVETGVIYSDHAILQPKRLTAGFTLTNWDLAGAKGVFETLEALIQLRQPMTVLTVHGECPRMLMTEIELVNELPAWGALVCTGGWQAVNLVTPKAARFSATQLQGSPREKTASSTVNKGSVSPGNTIPSGGGL